MLELQKLINHLNKQNMQTYCLSKSDFLKNALFIVKILQFFDRSFCRKSDSARLSQKHGFLCFRLFYSSFYHGLPFNSKLPPVPLDLICNYSQNCVFRGLSVHFRCSLKNRLNFFELAFRGYRKPLILLKNRRFFH